MQTIATGAIPSDLDYRDGIAAAAAVAPAAAAPGYFSQDLGGVLMQAFEPACVAFSLTKLIKLYWFFKTGTWIDLSPRFLDILMKRYDGQDRATGGAIPRLGLKLAMQYGICTTAMLPNDTTLPVLQYRDDSLLTPAVMAEALKYRIPGFACVPVDFATTRAFLSAYRAISTLMEIGVELYTPSWADKDIDPLRTPKAIVSGHQMTQCGIQDPKLNLIENQWSEAWGNRGRVQFDPVAWAPFTIEQWVIAEIPPDIAAFLKTLPSPNNFYYQYTKNLSQGQVSEDVKYFQIGLMILGFLAPIAPNEFGIFGPKTAAANLRAQISAGVPVHERSAGNFGPLTRGFFNRKFAI